MITGVRPSQLKRVLSDLSKGDCWEWTLSRDCRGYGRTRIGSRKDGTRRSVMVHRLVYEALVGPIPAGLTLDHLCRNPPCANPAHLEPVTHEENVRRAAASKTHCPQGHPYAGENLYINATSGARVCRACQRDAKRRFLDRAYAKTEDGAG